MLVGLNILSAANIMLPSPVFGELATGVAREERSLLGEGRLTPLPEHVGQKIKKIMEITGYSSSVDETDDTPHTTALGTKTRYGVVAANQLPFGARVKIPLLFGLTQFVVEDRMNKRFADRLDIWFPSKAAALKFGKQTAEVEIEL